MVHNILAMLREYVQSWERKFSSPYDAFWTVAFRTVESCTVEHRVVHCAICSVKYNFFIVQSISISDFYEHNAKVEIAWNIRGIRCWWKLV